MSQDLSISSTTQTVNAETFVANRVVSRNAILRRAAAGAFLGSAWGAGMRAWMVILALEFGDRPNFTWLGTFGAILLPAALMGAMLGWAASVAETTDSKRWRWEILSPLLLVLAPAVLMADFIPTLLATGLGGGAIGVALIGLLGGYGLSGIGASWLRWVSGLLALILTLASGIGLFFFGNSNTNISPGAGEAFAGLFFILLMGLLVAGISAPSRYQSKNNNSSV